MPIDHTSTALSAAAYMLAKRAMSAEVAPDMRSRSANDSSSSSASRPSKPTVLAGHELPVEAAHRQAGA